VIGDQGETVLPRDNHKSQITNHKSVRRVALKVDCDTLVGTRAGVPRLLDLFARKGIRATFFFSFGPDRSGVAVRRFLTRPGFARKMLRSRAVSLYGFPTVLYGTLLPAPLIGERCAAEIRSAGQAGHETGVHAWDHVGWHDGLDGWTVQKIHEEYGRAHGEYRRIFGERARAAAAPGWTVNSRSLGVEEDCELLYTSNSRGGSPFFPKTDGRVFRTLEVPSTLPTLDETLAWRELATDEDQRKFFRTAVRGTEVHTIHAEIEGRSKLPLFSRILEEWLADGVTFLRLEELARAALERREEIPVRTLVQTTLPGRGGTVATGWPADSEGR
jgi:undecaprenyl phosphate-alpha-L-ara4FN deformylase